MSPRPSAETHRVASYGRGGAGNIGSDKPTAHPQPADLVTPTLKSELYTTGRGGTGNMARNDPNHPELARASQDVEVPPHREADGPHHFGRGGAANVAKGNSPEPQVDSGKSRKSEDKNLVEKGKDLLHKLKK